jgi:hypothetical protein
MTVWPKTTINFGLIVRLTGFLSVKSLNPLLYVCRMAETKINA